MDPSPFLAATACLCFHRIASPATPPRPRIGFGTSYKVMAPANTFSARDPRTPFSAFAIPDHISRTNAPAPQKDSRGDRDRGTNTQHKQKPTQTRSLRTNHKWVFEQRVSCVGCVGGGGCGADVILDERVYPCPPVCASNYG